MVEARPIPIEQLIAAAHEAGLRVPIEQTELWGAYEETIEGRGLWGSYVIAEGETPLAFVTLTSMDTHGYRYLRSLHGPLWVEAPDAARESEGLAALAAAVRERERSVAFLRLAIAHELPETRPVLSTVPYDKTVVMDLHGGDEDAIFADMKPRGRRDVRKALRECPAVFADETETASEDFSPYYAVMQETAERDGFVPAPASDYQDLLDLLAPDHARLFAGRVDGVVRAWTLATLMDGYAVRYYAASSSETRRQHIPDMMIIRECVALAGLGCAYYDHMGIGSDFSPSLSSLNEFKTKFSKEVVDVAPNRDLPLRKNFYRALEAAKGLKGRIGR